MPGPVDRPNLSKDFLAGKAPMEWVTLRDDAFYEKLGIEFIKADKVTELDPKGKSIKLESGRTVPYDKLLLATGSEPVRLPIDGASLPHVKTLRTLADAQAIIAASANCPSRGRHWIQLHRARSRCFIARAQSRSGRSQPRQRSAREHSRRAGGRLRAEAARREGRSFSPRRPIDARFMPTRSSSKVGSGSRPM